MSTVGQDEAGKANDDRLVAASVTAIEEACARAGFRVAVDNDMFALRRYLRGHQTQTRNSLELGEV